MRAFGVWGFQGILGFLVFWGLGRGGLGFWGCGGSAVAGLGFGGRLRVFGLGLKICRCLNNPSFEGYLLKPV